MKLGMDMDNTASNATPMMKQYIELKSQHPDAILFFRLGDFYEMFFDDALKAADILQITLTSRSKGPDKVPMAGIPFHAARRYIAKLIEAGLKVAICEQVEPPGKSGLVRREVVRVITPGMVVDEEVLEAKENNFLAAVKYAKGGAFGVAMLDASTGAFFVFPLLDGESLRDELAKFSVRELLLSKESPSYEVERLLEGFSPRPLLVPLEEEAFDFSNANAALCTHFHVLSLESFGLKDNPASIAAAGAALNYLLNTQKTAATHLTQLQLYRRSEHLLLDDATIGHLEIVKTARDGQRKGSLLGVIDRTTTTLGARKLTRWILSPLTQKQEIEARYNLVEAWRDKSSGREQLRGLLKEVADIERLCARLSLASGTPRDMRVLGQTLSIFPKITAVVSGIPSALLDCLLPLLESKELQVLAEKLLHALIDEPPISLTEGGFMRGGFCPELDEVMELASSGKEWLLKVEAKERKCTGIHSLKLRYNRVFGYYMEVSKANLHLVPTHWTRKQTMVGAERFVTEELQEYERKILDAQERRIQLELRWFETLRQEIIAKVQPILAAADALSTVDVLSSFAQLAVENGYTRPVIEEGVALEMVDGRHPVVEQMIKPQPFIPNSLSLSADDGQVVLITGPNMAGKSTVMRQVALCVVMAQAGCFVPAQRMRLGICDRLFSRVGASDNLSRGQSTFMLEMVETANILHNATPSSFIILDEIGRGTATFDGLSLAWAVAEYLCEAVKARCLFATHYHELTVLAHERANVRNCSIAVQEKDGKILFLRKLVEGPANKSYGIEVARLAGLPPRVLKRAKELLANLEAKELDETGRPSILQETKKRRRTQLGLFEEEAAKQPSYAFSEEILEAIAAFPVPTTTPLEALSSIAKWQAKLGHKTTGKN
ncbi:MAG: DNA mismatch repair protein MutS [Proteobacteria bacterium]|nr:DNA mismatch repair protein MutS [Cystobacterineae bacterium]MCL2258219.1 DNA mismatch repair protein MutS [Cystobacterineae bacterium]MCL2315437.1 DNA mismatch repair protein MutS [Pseudomonadota bacterium]